MATIKPTLSIVANDASATTLPGPMSTALSLSTSQSVGVDYVYSDTTTVTTSEAVLFDGDTQDWKPTALGGSGDAAGGKGGTGGFVYLKNITVSGSYVIHIGVGDDTQAATDLTGADQDDDMSSATRFMTLERGEFAFFPWDYTTRIYVDTDNNGVGDTIPKLEWWIFDRATYTLP